MAGKLFNIYSGNTGGVLSTSTAKVGSFGTTSDDFYSVNFDTGRKSIWTNNIEFGRAADWGNISGIPSWIGSDGVTWAKVKDKPATATRWPYWSEILSKPTAVGSATQPVYWDGSTFQLVNSVAPANHDHDNKYVKLDGTNVMSGDLTLNLADLDRFIVFSYYNTVNPTSNSWRTGVLGTGYGENNFFVVQYQRINTNSSDWYTAFKIGQDTGTVTFTNNIKVGSYTVYHSGNLPTYPTVNNGALYLQANGTTKVTFTANQSSNLTFNIATGSSNGTISVGGTDVAVKGLGSNAYSSTAYLPLAGGTMDEGAQIKRKGKGGAWIYGRDNALIRETSSSGYHALFSLKTTDGSWELGEYNTSGWYNIPVFSYITDTNYNSGNNSATYQIKYPLASGTIALTADLTWSKIADKPATATRWPSWDEVTSKPSVFPAADHNHDSRYPRKFSYTLPSQKGVRISYTPFATVLVSVCGSNSGAQLVIIGTGYGEGGRIRNQFTELVSCNLFDWSIPNSNSISCSVEIFSNKDSNSTVLVISTDNITFTEINALTSPKENATLLNSSNYTLYTVKKDGTGATGTWGINISGNAATATKWQNARTLTIGNTGKTVDGTGNVSWSLSEIGAASSGHNHDDRYLKLSGGTLTGVLHLLSSQYADTAGTGALDLANSDIYGVNSIKFADLSDSAGEGLQWYRDATHVDSIWVKNGVIYFSPNRTWGGSVTNNTVYHSGNLTAATLLGSTAKGTTSKPIYWDGSKIVECLAYSQASVNYANTAGDADTLDGYHLSQITPVVTQRDFINGTLVKTNIPFPGTNTSVSQAFLLTVKGNGYGGGIINFEFQGYVYYTSSYANPQIINSDFIIYSPNSIDKIYTMSIDNKLCFWWARQVYWQGFHIFCTTNTELYQNRVTEVQDVSKPTGLFEQNYTPKISLTSGNYTDYTVTKTGTGATGTWGINISGNAGSADKLKTARTITINGSSKTFDGSGNISWSLADLNLSSNEHNHDDRYLKLAGGTMTGAIKRHYTAASDDPFYSVTSNNLNIWVWRVMHNASAASVSTSASYGFGLKYLGAGDGNNNDLALYSDNQAGTQVEAIRIKQDGAVTFSKQISSTLATGTSPFKVTSTTVNTNLNADLLDGVHASGLFTNFSNKTVSGNKVLAATIGGKELTVGVEYANSANTANSATTAAVLLTNNTSQNADSCYTGAPGLRFWRYNGTSSTTGQSGGDGWILSWSWNQGSVGGQIYLDDNPSKTMCIRGFNNSDSTFTTWAKILHTDNISPSLPISGNTIAVTVGGVTSSYITVPYATSAGNADTLDTFHANGLFQTFTNDATTNAVKIKIGNTEKSLVVGYATKANSANSATSAEYAEYLAGYTSQDPNTCSKGTGVKLFYNLNTNSGYAGTNYGFPCTNNANAILWIGAHYGPYGGQLGISSNSELYYRYISNNSFPTTANGGSWKKILTTTNWSSTTDGRYLRWAGNSADVTAMTWGTLTTANGYTILSHGSSSDGGDMGFVNKGGQIFMQLDGYYYQNEGRYRVTDVSETVTALGTSGNYLTWTKDGTTNSITVPYASNADTVDNKHAEDFIYRLRRSNNNVTGQPNNGMIPPAILEFLSAGYPVYTDPEFASGNNSCSVYNNQGNGTVTIERITDNQGSGNSSGYILKITTNGTASPSAGGFVQTIDSRANAIFMQVFRAKVPVGWSVYNAENAQGDNATITWLTDRAGTGKWEWYARLVYCGNTGSFHNGGHVYLSGTSNTSVTWYLSHITLVDITKGNYNGLRTRYADHATSSDSASSVAWANITGKATSKTAWGQTFVDASGNIQSIYGDMTSVGKITPDGNATRDNGTSSANWANVYTRNIISGDHLTLRSGTSKDIIFQTNAGTEQMRLTANGKLGLGRVPTASDARLTMPANTVAIDFRPDHSSYNARVEYMTSGYEALVFATKQSWTSFIFMNGLDLTDRSDYSALGTAALQIKSNGVAINRPIYGDNGMFYGDPGNSGAKLVVGGLVKTISNSKYLVIGCQNSNWAHYETDAVSGHYFYPGISVHGAIYIYGTNYGIRSDGEVHGNGFYHRSYLDNNYVLLSNGGAKQWSESATANTIVARNSSGYVYAVYYNSAISNQDDMSPTSVYCSNDNWIRKQSIGTFADNLRSEEIISIDKSLTITEAWMDTGIVCDTTTFPRGTGTYAVQVCASSMTSDSYYPYYSGIMTIYTSRTNSSGNDEVALHCAGYAVGTDYKRLYIRTQEQASPNYNKIQIAGSSNLSKAYTITFKFRKLI